MKDSVEINIWLGRRLVKIITGYNYVDTEKITGYGWVVGTA